jgi:hypothetical protein
MLLTEDDNREGSSQGYIFEIFQCAAKFLCTNAYCDTSRLEREVTQDGQEDREGSSMDGSTLRKQKLYGTRQSEEAACEAGVALLAWV